jgi:hypothetical protein
MTVLALFDCQPVRPGWAGCKRGVEIQTKVLIQDQVIFGDASHVDFVVAFRVDFAETVLVQEVIADDQALFVRSESDVVRLPNVVPRRAL